MKHREWNRVRRPVSKLPLFPVPYPGESFYSILCRYHVRSGNINDWHTIGQLFGYNSSLGSTLLSPYHLDKVRDWLQPGTPILTNTLLQEHTAFPLYALTAPREDISRIRGMISGKIETTTYPRWVQSALIHTSGFLRYCPECAAAQKTLYGETYWQILPQLDGVEYCPLHKTRIRNSNVPIKGIRHKFYPASEALEHTDEPVQEDPVWEPLFHNSKEHFIKLSEGINWLFQNGRPYEGSKKLYQLYSKTFGKPEKIYWLSLSWKEIADLLPPDQEKNRLMAYMRQKVRSQLGDGAIYLYGLSLCTNVMLMNAACGNPQKFYLQ